MDVNLKYAMSNDGVNSVTIYWNKDSMNKVQK